MSTGTLKKGRWRKLSINDKNERGKVWGEANDIRILIHDGRSRVEFSPQACLSFSPPSFPKVLPFFFLHARSNFEISDSESPTRLLSTRFSRFRVKHYTMALDRAATQHLLPRVSWSISMGNLFISLLLTDHLILRGAKSFWTSVRRNAWGKEENYEFSRSRWASSAELRAAPPLFRDVNKCVSPMKISARSAEGRAWKCQIRLLSRRLCVWEMPRPWHLI